MENLQLIFLLNTIKQKTPPGLTFYDLGQNGKFPAAKIYRQMKKLEADGILTHVEVQESGKPKYLYRLSSQGETLRNELQEKIKKTTELLKIRFPEAKINIDEKIIQEGTFQLWCSPVEFLLQQNISDEEKLERLSDMEMDISAMLKKIQLEKKKLEKKQSSSN